MLLRLGLLLRWLRGVRLSLLLRRALLDRLLLLVVLLLSRRLTQDVAIPA